MLECPNGCAGYFQQDTTVAGMDLLDHNGDVLDTKTYESEVVGPVVCSVCEAPAVEERAAKEDG